MKQKELELLVSLGHIEKIEVRRPQGAASGWLVIAWTGENALRRFAPELETAKGEPREFASLDAVFRTPGIYRRCRLPGDHQIGQRPPPGAAR